MTRQVDVFLRSAYHFAHTRGGGGGGEGGGRGGGAGGGGGEGGGEGKGSGDDSLQLRGIGEDGRLRRPLKEGAPEGVSDGSGGRGGSRGSGRGSRGSGRGGSAGGGGGGERNEKERMIGAWPQEVGDLERRRSKVEIGLALGGIIFGAAGSLQIGV